MSLRNIGVVDCGCHRRWHRDRDYRGRQKPAGLRRQRAKRAGDIGGGLFVRILGRLAAGVVTDDEASGISGRAGGQRDTVSREKCLKRHGVAQHNANRATHEFQLSMILIHVSLPREPNTPVSPGEAGYPNAGL